MTRRNVEGAPLLGELEAAVMERLWDAGECDVKAMHRAIGVRRHITVNTVQSTMERLYRKGLLGRTKVSHAYVYRPEISREAYGAQLVEDVLGQVMRGDREPLLAAFVDLAARAGKDELDRLERLIADRRQGLRRAKP
jgi:predicted transcriptional regulator